MKSKPFILTIALITLLSGFILAQDPETNKLPFLWNELTAPEFIKAVDQSKGICILPAGVMEKHGPHLPLSTDMILAREIASRGAELEYALVFPEFYFGQIFEARHQPGTLAYSTELLWSILEESCEEMARNGIKKIILVNGHGGNNNFFAYFCQAQLAEQKDYTVVFFQPDDTRVDKETAGLRLTDYGGHADEVETSMLYAVRPDLVHADRGSSQSGKDQSRMSIPFGYTGIWWYASFPNHYAGDGSVPNERIGALNLQSRANQLAELIRFLKEDHTATELHQRFSGEAENPLKTEQ
jgi:creatinine amidohydrolase